MFGKVSEDSFPNIFDLSFDNEDSKCVFGSRGIDFLSPNTFNNNSNNNNNDNSSFELEDQQKFSTKSWRNDFSRSQQQQQQQQQQHRQDDLEKAFANLYKQRQPSSSAQDAFASSFFPFSLNSISEKSSTSFENNNINNNNNNNRKKLPYSSQPQATAGSNNYSSASSTCSSSALSSPNTSSGLLPESKVNASRYKTELCRPYQENGSCKYGEKCQFAHGQSDLRTVDRHPKYKTDLCKTYHSMGFCPYGPRCHFIHSLEELTSGATGSRQRSSPIPKRPSSVCSNPLATSATANDIAAAIAALRQLPIYMPERLSSPPGFGPRPLGLNSIESSGMSSASSLSPSINTDLEDGNDSLPRLPVFSRLSH